VNNKLYIILRVIKPAFNLYIKVRYDKKVNDKRQIDNNIFKVIKVYLNHLIIRDIIIKNRIKLIRYNKSRKRFFKSYTKYKESEKWYKSFKELEFNRFLMKINRIIILYILSWN